MESSANTDPRRSKLELPVRVSVLVPGLVVTVTVPAPLMVRVSAVDKALNDDCPTAAVATVLKVG